MNDNREPNPWTYASRGLQLVAIFLLGLYLGYRADQRGGTLPWGTLTGAAAGFAAGLYLFLRQVPRR